jgi:hypothetical protein
MNANVGTKKCKEMAIEEICKIQAEIQYLFRKCLLTISTSDCGVHKVQRIAEQLLAAVGKIINVGQDLNAITSCMLDVADNAEVDDRELHHVPHILAWAGWTNDLSSEVIDPLDAILRTVHELIGSSRGKKGGV